jgi:hypothetical protein
MVKLIDLEICGRTMGILNQSDMSERTSFWECWFGARNICRKRVDVLLSVMENCELRTEPLKGLLFGKQLLIELEQANLEKKFAE